MIALSVAKLKVFSPESEDKIFHNTASVLIKFFRFRSDWLAFFARISYFLNFWSSRNLIKQLFHSRLLDMRLVGYLPSHIQRALIE